MAFIEENGPLSGGTTVAPTAVSGDASPTAKRLSRMESVSEVILYLHLTSWTFEGVRRRLSVVDPRDFGVEEERTLLDYFTSPILFHSFIHFIHLFHSFTSS